MRTPFKIGDRRGEGNALGNLGLAYAYLGQVVTRHHLDGSELSGFRNLLVDYIQMVVEDVLRYTPTIATALKSRQSLATPHVLPKGRPVPHVLYGAACVMKLLSEGRSLALIRKAPPRMGNSEPG